MSPIASLVTDIEAALHETGGERRAVLLNRITNLFIEQLPDLNDDHVSVFDEVILCLALEIEFAARVELAERLADLTRGPRQTVQNLALDREIRVARPVLERSPCVHQDDLATIAKNRSADFLEAVTNRKSLPSRVTDILAERGNPIVIQRLVENSAFELSDYGLKILAEKAVRDNRLYRILKGRPDLALRHVGAILEAARQKARSEMRDVTEQSELLESALDVGAAVVTINPSILEMAEATRKYEKSANFVFSRPPDETEIITLLNHGRIAEALAAIAHLANLPRETLRQAYASPQFDPLLFIFRGLDLKWPTFAAILKTKSGGILPQTLHDSAFSSFNALSRPTAQRVMRFIAVRTVI